MWRTMLGIPNLDSFIIAICPLMLKPPESAQGLGPDHDGDRDARVASIGNSPSVGTRIYTTA